MNAHVDRHRSDIEALCRRFHVRRLELFGSAASGQAVQGRSDYDFLVEFEPLQAGTYADTYFGLLEALQALLDAPVDLVVTAAIRNPYFRQSVERAKALLYAA